MFFVFVVSVIGAIGSGLVVLDTPPYIDQSVVEHRVAADYSKFND